MRKISEVTSVGHYIQINDQPHPECVSPLSVLFLKFIQFHVLPSTKIFFFSNGETIVYYVNKWKLNTTWNNCRADRVRHPATKFLTQTGHLRNKENFINSGPVHQYYAMPDEQNVPWSKFKQQGQNYIVQKVLFLLTTEWINTLF